MNYQNTLQLFLRHRVINYNNNNNNNNNINNNNTVNYFGKFGVEHIPKEIRKLIGNKYVKTNIYRNASI